MPTCAVCRSAEHVHEQCSLAGGAVWRCATCGLVFLWPVPQVDSPSASDRSVLTDAHYTEMMLEGPGNLAAAERLARMATARHREYTRMLGRSDYRLLEVGCGTADLGPYYANLGVSYCGIDVDHRCVEAANARYPSITVEQRNLLDLGDSDRADVIAVSQVLEHVTQPVPFAERLQDLLTPGGVLHLDVPNHDGLGSLLNRSRAHRSERRWGAVIYPHHPFAYTAGTLRALFSLLLDTQVFQVVCAHPCWGQPLLRGSAVARLYWLACRLSCKGNLLVLVGRKPLPQRSA